MTPVPEQRPGLLERIRESVTTIDLVAIIGLALVAAGIGLLLSPAAALVVIGGALLLYAVAVSVSI